MIEQPHLETERLILRPLTSGDAPAVQQLAGRREIADTTISIPHPYSVEQAREWIARQAEDCARDKSVVFGIGLKNNGQLIGAIGLREIDGEHSQAEMGFWIAVEYWSNGYATEAAKAMLGFAFGHLKLNRIYAHHMTRNPASGRVLMKTGMQKEGVLRQRVRKWGVYKDVVLCAILREEWRAEKG